MSVRVLLRTAESKSYFVRGSINDMFLALAIIYTMLFQMLMRAVSSESCRW